MCGVASDEAVACCGSDSHGQARPPKGMFTSVSASNLFTCGMWTTGTVACWGDDVSGRASPPEGRFKSVSAGYDYPCGVRSDESVTCWGELNRLRQPHTGQAPTL